MLTFKEIESSIGINGINEKQSQELRDKYGINELTPPKRDPIWRQYLENYDDPVIKILLVALGISTIVSLIQGLSIFDPLGILIAILLATTISFYNEYRSGKEFDVLNAQRDLTGIKVLRDGKVHLLPIKDVVVGDYVIIEAGDGVPADGYVIHPDNLFIDESMFTGESEVVQKFPHDKALKGSFISCGRGGLLVSAVGDNTEMGKVAASLGIDHDNLTPLEEKLTVLAGLISKFGYYMAFLIIIALIFRGYFVAGELTGINISTSNYILQYFMLAVVIIVVAVPEGLPMSVALSLSIAMRKMTKANNLVKRMIACETIGSATTICTDKTGTITKNQMKVVETSCGKPIIPEEGAPKFPEEWIALNAAINSTAHIEDKDQKTIFIGSSTEGALLVWLKEHDLDYVHIRQKFLIKKQTLFDGSRKRMSTVVDIDGKKYLLVKGAPEIIASLCSKTPDISKVTFLASRAMRTLAFAHKEIIGDNDKESELIWDGFFGIRDNIRENVPDAVKSCHSAGIKIRMITGDNIETARAIAKETGILTHGLIIEGKDFRTLNEEERVKIAPNIDVMARADPLDKLYLVQALQKNDNVVAVTGDGTNDAPALKNADVGLAMGISGTEVAREASDIILLDDSFPTIVNAVWWGRALYENIQRFLIFQLTINFSACILVFLAPLLGFPPPFNIIQLLWINIIMDSLAALALCSEAPHRALMNKKPIPRNARIITPYMWRSIGITGIFFIIFGLLNMQFGFLGGDTPAEQSTIFFSAFVIAQIWNGINCRAINGHMPPFFKGNPNFFIIMGLILVAQICLVQFGGEVVGTVPLSIDNWLRIIVISASVLIVGFIVRAIPEKKKMSFT
jgi:Ca2+-transporting ATPase